MTPRPTPLSAYPYTQSDMVRVTGASMPQVRKIAKKLLRKKPTGSGNYLGFNFDDAVRISASRELLRMGVAASSLHSLFASIETPKVASAKPWSWLRTAEAHTQGAALVLLLTPRHAPAGAGAVFLTTAAQAVALLRSTQSVMVIDMNAIIRELEHYTGEQYTEQTPSSSTDPIA